MRQLLNPYLNNFKLLILVSCVITSCYSYNPIYNKPSKTSLNPKLGNYIVSIESDIDSSLLTKSKDKLVDFILSDINHNIITHGTDNEESSGDINLRIKYYYDNGIGRLTKLHLVSMGASIFLGLPFSGGTLKLQAEVEIYDSFGDFSYYETFTNDVKWKRSLYFNTHYSAAYSEFEQNESNLGIDKKVLNNMVYKVTNDFLMDLKKKLGQNFNLESINKKTQKNIDRNVSTLNNKKSKKHLSFQSSDSTFSINSIAVIPKEIKSCSGNILSADELAAFTETNILSHYNVTDRRHLEALLDEQRLQMSGLTLEETVLKSGCITNAQAYLFVREGCLKGDEIIELRLVHCETSTLIWSCTGINASLQEVLTRINEELAKE